MVVSYSGIAGKRGKNPTKIVIHNDGGSQGATAAFYKGWLEHHQPELGFAHYYVASDGTYQAEVDGNSAWHCANYVGNRDYIGIEVCQSLGKESTFLENEQEAFKLAASLCKKYGLNPSVSVFPLHRELSATDCPHRSFALHGKANAGVKSYYVSQVQKYMGNTSNTGSNSSSKPSKPSASTGISVDGMWGTATTKRLQKYLGTTQDGVISHQYKQKYNQNIYSAQFDKTLIGSNVIKAMQKRLKAKGFYSGDLDGLCGQSTVKALQKAFGTTQDGVISPVSNMVSAMQKALNNNKLPF